MGKKFKLYIDGDLKESNSFEREVNMGDMKIAKDFEQSNQFFWGDIYELRLYYTTFSPDRIETLTEAMD